jgi:hypothetical protein
MNGNRRRAKRIIVGTVVATALVTGPVTFASQGASAHPTGGANGNSSHSSNSNGRGAVGNAGGYGDRSSDNRRAETRDSSVADDSRNTHYSTRRQQYLQQQREGGRR